MARTQYTVTFPAAKAGDEVTWPNTVKVYPDASTSRPLGNGYIEVAAGSFTGWSDAASVTFTRAGTSDSVTVTTGSPTGTGAAVPTAASSTVTTVAYAATVTPAAGTGALILNVGALTGNLTLANPTGTPTDGQTIRVRLSQDGTGGRTITFDTQYAFGTDVTSTLVPTTASAAWEMLFSWHAGSSKWRAISIIRGF